MHNLPKWEEEWEEQGLPELLGELYLEEVVVGQLKLGVRLLLVRL